MVEVDDETHAFREPAEAKKSENLDAEKVTYPTALYAHWSRSGPSVTTCALGQVSPGPRLSNLVLFRLALLHPFA